MLLPTTVDKIYEIYEQEEHPRVYLGASLIGAECSRYIYYCFRWAKPERVKPRIRSIFETGNVWEDRLIKNLEDAGIEVHDKQASLKDEKCVWLQGHCDGSIDPVEAPKTRHVLEIKSMAEKYFKQFLKEGVASFTRYYCQAQLYMGWLGYTRAIFLVVNKNTDERASERIEYSGSDFKALRMRADSIVFATEIPQKLSENPADYRCKMCNMYGVCHGAEKLQKNCRTCKQIRFANKQTKCYCILTDEELDYNKQREGCTKWSMII